MRLMGFFKEKVLDFFYSSDAVKSGRLKTSTRKTLKKKTRIFDIPGQYQRFIKGREQAATAFVMLILLMALWFLYLFFGTWSIPKAWLKISQDQEIELPGLNPFDKKK